MKNSVFNFRLLASVAFFAAIFFSQCKKEIPLITEQVAQTHEGSKKCSANEKYQKVLRDYPEVVENRRKIEAFTQQFVADYGKSTSDRAVVTIPVVVHVVWNTTNQNISDAQIMSQLDVLNKDFRRLNADAANTPAVFKPLAADVEVNFCLAKQDPQGNITTGIVRRQTNVTSFSSANDNIMFYNNGGSNVWDSGKYLNIYVCNLTDLLGYAYYPGVPTNIDGVVIAYTAFGTTGTATAPYHQGRTGTHEVGHWLNLNHIWGDDDGACTGSDEVDDTPNSGDSNGGCPNFPTFSCSNSPNGDMFMNYMDYADDNCQNLFTNGQKTRVRALFANGGARSSLLTSSACNAPNPPTNTCTDNFEPNNTNTTAKNLPLNTNATALISTSTDVDWFTFNNTSAQRKIKVNLSNLPADYDVFLYRNNTLVGSSENDAVTNEQIILNTNTVGTYRIKVVGYNGVSNATSCYTVKAQIGTANF
jgi:Pregnancy-associated plasma protein-A